MKLPFPKLVTFYNGTEGQEDKFLSLSDAFECGKEGLEPDIEVKVRMLNINYGKNIKLMEDCTLLAEYSWLVEQIRENKIAGADMESAVDQAIDEMPKDYVIRPFLMGNRAEVKDTCITEYNEAETMEMFREEGRIEGEGRFARLVSMLLSILLYLKPIISGVGNYYLEAQTRDARRTDVVVDYLGEQFVVEMKIWHGNEYNERGEEQLLDYLNYFRQEKGYMLSFNFNKKKEPGVKVITLKEKTIVEAVV